MRNTEKQELKRRIKRLGLFFLIVLVPSLVLAVVLEFYAQIPQWATVLVLVVVLSILYLVFLWICSKLDKQKEERMSKKKDPFSD